MSPPEPIRRSHWVPEIDGLRAIACLMVVLAHFTPAAVALRLAVLNGPKTLSPGNVGVVLFLTLSAFLLTLLGLREYERAGTINVGQFYVRRSLRIWPLYYVALVVITIILAPWGPFGERNAATDTQWDGLQTHWWLYTFFLSNWDAIRMDPGQWIDEFAVLWTISAEEQFYLLFPLALWAGLRWRLARVVLPVGCVVISWAWRLSASHVLPPSWTPYYATFDYLDVFASGAIAAWWCVRGRAGWLGHPLVGVGAVAALLAIGYVGDTTRSNIWFAPGSGLNLLLIGAVGPLDGVLLACIYLNRGSVWLGALRSDALRTLGILSYGIYIWHMAVARLSNIHTESLRGEPTLAVQIAVHVEYLSVLIGLAAITYWLVEQPALSLKDRFGVRRAATGWTAKWRGALACSFIALVVAEATIWASGFRPVQGAPMTLAQVRDGERLAVHDVLVNGSFEDGAAGAGWQIIGTPVVDRSGTESRAGRTAVQVSDQSYLVQFVPGVSPGARYELRFAARTAASTSVGRLQLNWLDAQGQLVAVSIDTFPASKSWQDLHLVTDSPPGATIAAIYLIAHSGAIWVDDATFGQIQH